MTIKNSGGFITLFTVLVLGALGLAISTSMLLLGTDAARTSLVISRGENARMLADTCAEYALNVLRRLPTYAGGETRAFLEGACEILPLEGSGGVRVIKAIGRAGDAVRRVEIRTSALRPRIQISSWREVANF